MLQIPHPPAVNNFATPSPISPSINLSTPKAPTKIEITSNIVGSLKPIHSTTAALLSSASSNSLFYSRDFFCWEKFSVSSQELLNLLIIHNYTSVT